ncbi:hypothetical protein ENU1_065820 [Entamoeba nuttalli P19]|uniref:TLDc domain-containing protein n=1 Tax=Entamoeba nuttalli (strain P19) TaxID=1076696 RepID=K2HEM0_ENTNP|nr:hypothetical protein ENU1_065820 [Entamoeba nuttalli P19]EKE41164.1 hypothetical protein ENU1_065820 [Entamoeba nuttalli P19]|eukprot:XP_008856502.1 hypothetical protein ENU1_065820 [Entamoeba nuttalli P19]
MQSLYDKTIKPTKEEIDKSEIKEIVNTIPMSEFTEFKKQMESKINRVESKLNEVQESVKIITAELTRKADKNYSNQKKINEFVEDFINLVEQNRIDDAINTLFTHYKYHDEKLEDLTTRVDTNDTNIKFIQQQVIDKLKDNERIKEFNDDQLFQYIELRLREEKKQDTSPQDKSIEIFVSKEEHNQIEKWTGLKKGQLLFDSTLNKWDTKSSEFGKSIIEHSNIVVIIEDDMHNKFGIYLHSFITKIDEMIEDSNAFVFSLTSNHRFNGMVKFDIKKEEGKNAFLLKLQRNEMLFKVGYGPDIVVYKKDTEKQCQCKQSSFDYRINGEEIHYALTGRMDQKFTPERIVVFQMEKESSEDME